jgi:hypothetical protein
MDKLSFQLVEIVLLPVAAVVVDQKHSMVVMVERVE